MVVARASGMDLASILKRNTFLTLGVRPARGPGSARDGGPEKGPRDGGPEKGPPAVRGVGGVPPPGGSVPPHQQHQGGAPPHVGCQRNLSSKPPHRQRAGLMMGAGKLAGRSSP